MTVADCPVFNKKNCVVEIKGVLFQVGPDSIAGGSYTKGFLCLSCNAKWAAGNFGLNRLQLLTLLENVNKNSFSNI